MIWDLFVVADKLITLSGGSEDTPEAVRIRVRRMILLMKNTCFITLPIAIFFSRAFVMQLLTFNQCNFKLN